MLSQGPPYAPRNQGLGGNPEVIPDVPITAIFLVLYLVFGIIHIKIFKANKGRGHKFIFNGAILGMSHILLYLNSLPSDFSKDCARSVLLQCPCA